VVKPSPPQWALDAGLPAPKARESFEKYCLRLGFSQDDIDELLTGLNDRTYVLANSRLAAYLVRRLPEHWEAYKKRRRLSAIGTLAK